MVIVVDTRTWALRTAVPCLVLMPDNPFAALPRTDMLLARAENLCARFGRQATKVALTTALEELRGQISVGIADWTGTPDAVEALIDQARNQLQSTAHPGPRRVINAAGVVVHTNLGRAPLSAAAVAAMVDAAGYCDLEFDLTQGTRGSRGSHVDGLLAALTGAEDAMVVNNCAAALVLALSVLAGGQQVPVSRGQLVEIGGSFRLPDIMAASGATLLEVGTTNRTRASDYRAGADVGALLTVHPSNFSQVGFVTQPTLTEVAGIAHQRGVPLIHDIGSGLPVHSDGVLATAALVNEGSMAEALEEGADLVLASGDKLLGGPQAGLIVGRADLVMRLRKAPLARALRVDKLRLAALNATLRDHLRGESSTVESMLATDSAALASLRSRVQSMAARLGGQVVTATTMIGGGSAPGVGVESPVVGLPEAQQLLVALRRANPPVVGRINNGRVLLDLRTVDPSDDDKIVDSIQKIRQSHLPQ